MEGLSIAGPNPCVSSSLLHTLSSKSCNFSCIPFCRLSSNSIQNQHLVKFQQAYHLFSSIPHVPRRNHRARTSQPHLVASMEQVEQTYIMIKPDGVQRGLVGDIISRFERKGFKLIGLKLFQCTKELVEEHYKDLQSKRVFPETIDHITSGPVVCMVWEGVGVVASTRKLIGARRPFKAVPRTVRGGLAVEPGRNVVHGSDSPDNGKREIALWFEEGELCEWTSVQEPWLME